jgi:hypothetical protein
MKGQLRLFYFASDLETNNNQTFLVSSIGVSNQNITVGFKGIQIRYYLYFINDNHIYQIRI